MSQNMPLAIPSSVEDRMLTFPRTDIRAHRHETIQHSLPRMEKCISLMDRVIITPYTQKGETKVSWPNNFIANNSNKQRESIRWTLERMQPEKRKKKKPTGNCHAQIWTDSRKTKFQGLCTSFWINKCSSECFWWQLYLSVKIQEFSTTALHSTGLLSDYRILSFTNKSIWLNTIPLNIRYVFVFNFIWHPLRNYLIFGIFA